MLKSLHSNFLSLPGDFWSKSQYLTFPALHQLADRAALHAPKDEAVRKLFSGFNTSDLSRARIYADAQSGQLAALELAQYLEDHYSDGLRYHTIAPEEFRSARTRLLADPESFVSANSAESVYPHYVPGRTYGYNVDWVRESLQGSARKLTAFSAGRTCDTAVLVGNGPSLRHVDFSLLRGQDVFISNYAIKHPELADLARGVAVTNYLVAEQEPYWFNLADCWKFFPFWLTNSVNADSSTILLNAVGGKLFFSPDVLRSVSWHSTVSYFWLQILYSAGYRKVVLIGFDNSYQQAPTLKEGDTIKQTDDDPNHFDPNYFKGKHWQAADTGKMADTYKIAKDFYEADGRVIVNATVGGKLEVFPRGQLERELHHSSPRRLHRRPTAETPKVAVATAFWSGDIKQAELHWKLLERLGANAAQHIYIFKHSREELPPVNLPRVTCLDIDSKYPDARSQPHPAGPNLCFVETLRLLAQTDYTHVFWMEPDCVPTAANWLDPFLKRLEQYPDEAVVGTGGGTVQPGKPHWKNHFCGCSLYNIARLTELDWDKYVSNELGVSFDIWLSVNLGYIELGPANDSDDADTIIYGSKRHDWKILRKPPALVTSMFEHWRPTKFLTPEKLEERLSWPAFSLYHAIKDDSMLRRLYKRLPRSASTIIINYNNERFLAQAIESALSQDSNAAAYEVIVVDDGSSDSSREIISSFGNRIQPILLNHGKLNANHNQQRALKEGLRRASGEIILLLDGDDVFYPPKLQSVLDSFDDPDVVLVQHVVDLIDGDGQSMNKQFRAFPADQVTPALYQKTGRVNFYQGTSGLSFRRSYLRAQLHHLSVNGHDGTWLDVRLSRFAPHFGKVLSRGLALGAWRRHAASDSIRSDNVAERVKSHEQWYDSVATQSGLPAVPFAWKTHTALLGPHPREHQAHFDETNALSVFLQRVTQKGVMLDVGAHEGFALEPFLSAGWKIWAFEPDVTNRSKLEKRLNAHRNKANVTLDTRCVTKESTSNLAFYRSEESTGISGLSAFRDSHRVAQRVDSVSLSDYFKGQEMPEVDFLKIDTEGHDLFVLQGFPWDRNKPRVIECEFEDLKTKPLGYTTKDMADFLVGKGYTVYVSEWHPILRYGQRHDWRCLQKFPCELACEEAWGNLLAFSEAPDEGQLTDAIKSVMKAHGSAVPTRRTPLSSPDFEHGRQFVKNGPREWLLRHDPRAQQQLIIANFSGHKTSNRSFVGLTTLESDQRVTVNISIGRIGSKPYEGSGKNVVLAPNQPQTLIVRHKFKEEHSGVKVQIDLKHCGAPQTTISMKHCVLLPAADGGVDSSPQGSSLAREANQFFREQHYAESTSLYAAAARTLGLKTFAFNARLSLRRLGISDKVTIEECLSRLA